MTDTTPDYAGLSRSLGALAYHIQQTGTADGQDAQTCLEVAEAIRELLAENERLKEDRARFPDKPDDIGRMIEAHIGNLKEGKKSAEALADKAFDRAFRAEAALDEKDKEIAALGEALHVALGALRKIADTDLSGCADMTTAELFGALSRMHETATQALRRASRRAADYRILGPGELDAETVERAAQVAESTPAYGDPVEISVGLGPVGERIASAIRALKDSQPQTERQAE